MVDFYNIGVLIPFLSYMRKYLFLLAFLALHLSIMAQSDSLQKDTTRHQVLFATTMGNIKVELYNETPLHRDNFLKLVRNGDFDGMLFHRVISGFMIQTGDPRSKEAKPGEYLGEHEVSKEEIPAEILFPKFWHKRGALAAARQPDNINPERKSSSSQFYIVYGKRFRDSDILEQQRFLDERTGGKVKLTPELKKAYYEIGGYPSLDGQYTVFGEVFEGINVVKMIQWVDTDKNDRPVEDVRIVKATIIK